jgi:hypothetical protein
MMDDTETLATEYICGTCCEREENTLYNPGLTAVASSFSGVLGLIEQNLGEIDGGRVGDMIAEEYWDKR